MIISVLNLKGGSGKTTISTNLAVYYAEKKRKVLLIDTDIQGSSVRWRAEREITNTKLNVVEISNYKALQKQIDDFQNNYEVIIIDGAPAVDILATASIALSDLVLIPVNPSPYDIWSTEIMIERINQSKKIKTNLKAAFVINRFSTRTNLSADTIDALKEFSLPVIKTKICHRVAYPDSALSGLSVIEWNDLKAKDEIFSLGKEIDLILKK